MHRASTFPTKRRLTAPQVMERYGISEMSLWRWLRDPSTGFPRPIIICSRRYFDENELDAFDDAHRLPMEAS